MKMNSCSQPFESVIRNENFKSMLILNSQPMVKISPFYIFMGSKTNKQKVSSLTKN